MRRRPNTVNLTFFRISGRMGSWPCTKTAFIGIGEVGWGACGESVELTQSAHAIKCTYENAGNDPNITFSTCTECWQNNYEKMLRQKILSNWMLIKALKVGQNNLKSENHRLCFSFR